jgi:hypothetical protein
MDMNRNDNHPKGEWSQRSFDNLRRALEEGQTPAGLTQLLAMLDNTEQSERNEAEDEVLLAQLMSAALHGVDIQRRFPRSFQRLVTDPALRDAFLEGLQALEEETPATLPFPANRDLSFLSSLRRKPVSQPRDGSGAWKTRWSRSAEEIAGLFSFLSFRPSPALREAAGFLEDETVTLLRGKLVSKGMELDVTLEATRPAAQPDELHLSLWVLASNEKAALRDDSYALSATVTWGSYEVAVKLTGDGHYELPSRAIAGVLDDFEKSKGSLTITVQQDT